MLGVKIKGLIQQSHFIGESHKKGYQLSKVRQLANSYSMFFYFKNWILGSTP